MNLYTENEIASFENVAYELGGRIIQRETTPDGATLIRIRIGNRDVTIHEDPDEAYYIN